MRKYERKPADFYYIAGNDIVYSRIQSIRASLKHYGITAKHFGELTGIPGKYLTRYMNKMQLPHLKNYFTFAEFFEWDLSRDINYLWYTERYSAKDIARRLVRVGIHSNSDFPAGSAYDLYYFFLCLKGTGRRSIRGYALHMRYIRSLEIEYGYSDIIEMED